MGPFHPYCKMLMQIMCLNNQIKYQLQKIIRSINYKKSEWIFSPLLCTNTNFHIYFWKIPQDCLICKIKDEWNSPLHVFSCCHMCSIGQLNFLIYKHCVNIKSFCLVHITIRCNINIVNHKLFQFVDYAIVKYCTEKKNRNYI